MRNFINKNNISWYVEWVIMDSVPVRNRGFELVLKELPKEQVELGCNYILNKVGCRGTLNLSILFKEIKREKVTEKEVNEWAYNFSIIMREKLLQPTLCILDSLNLINENFKKT